MIRHSIVNTLAIIFWICAFVSCKISPNETFSIKSVDSTTKVIKIPISNLAKHYKSYQGQYIETTGLFYGSFEDFAIYTDTNILTEEADGFWLETQDELNIGKSSFDKMRGKLVTIKGRIDTTRNGHLGYYLATIDRIYFWQY